MEIYLQNQNRDATKTIHFRSLEVAEVMPEGLVLYRLDLAGARELNERLANKRSVTWEGPEGLPKPWSARPWHAETVAEVFVGPIEGSTALGTRTVGGGVHW